MWRTLAGNKPKRLNYSAAAKKKKLKNHAASCGKSSIPMERKHTCSRSLWDSRRPVQKYQKTAAEL
jgi:hypothetical protein